MWLAASVSRRRKPDDVGVPMRAQNIFDKTNSGSAHTVGVTTAFTAILAGVVTGLALAESTNWSTAVVMAAGLAVGVLVGAVGRAVVTGPVRGWRNIGGRAAVAVAVGVVLGELAALVGLAPGARRALDDQAARQADVTPSIVQASKQLDQDRQLRATLAEAVDRARVNRDNALVVARCEYNPRPGCPQTQITGDAGDGPETQTANDILADSQREPDRAPAERDARVPGLDAQIVADENALAQSRAGVIAAADNGLGARWVAMNHYTTSSLGAMVLRLITVAFFALLTALPLILKVWRGETAQDRRVVAEAAREKAELDADTAVAVKRAEIRAASETLWVERELESARLAVAAETEIERVQQRRRVFDAVDAVGGPAPRFVSSEPVGAGAIGARTVGADVDDLLPIEAEAAAATRSAALPAPVAPVNAPMVHTPENLPEKVDQGGWAIPDVAGAAARWVRPFVPPIVANAIDATTHPLRTARQVFEEVEEIGLTLKRTRRTIVEDAAAPYPDSGFPPEPPIVAGPVPQQGWVQAGPTGWYGYSVPQPPLAADYPAELPPRDGAPELPRNEGPWQLPPAY